MKTQNEVHKQIHLTKISQSLTSPNFHLGSCSSSDLNRIKVKQSFSSIKIKILSRQKAAWSRLLQEENQKYFRQRSTIIPVSSSGEFYHYRNLLSGRIEIKILHRLLVINFVRLFIIKTSYDGTTVSVVSDETVSVSFAAETNLSALSFGGKL